MDRIIFVLLMLPVQGFCQDFLLNNADINRPLYADSQTYAYRAWVIHDGKRYLVDRTAKSYLECDNPGNYMDWPDMQYTLAVEKNGHPCVVDIYGRETFCLNENHTINYVSEVDMIPFTEVDPTTGETLHGWLDAAGNKIIPAQFIEAPYTTWEPYAAVRRTSKWIFINKSGEQVIDAEFDDANMFYYNRATVMLNGKWGIIDTTGAFIVPCQYDWIEGISHNNYNIQTEAGYGLISNTGEILIEPKYAYMTDFSVGRALVNIGGISRNKDIPLYYCDGGEWLVINEAGEIVYRLDCDFIGHYGSHSFAQKGGLWGIISANGTWEVAPEFDALYYFTFSQKFTAQKNGKWGIIDAAGKWIAKPGFDSIGICEFGLARACLEGKWGFIDADAQWVIPPQFDHVSDFMEIELPK